jgi:processive 1,2-diacylglycerol beta-glucosyltransferase
MNVLLLHASAGAGHTRAAEALAKGFKARGAGVDVRDILDFTAPVFRKTYAAGYLNVVRTAPELWGYMYARTDQSSQKPWEKRVRMAFNRLNTLKFLRFLREAQPDAVVCTHFMPLELMGTRRSRHRPRIPLYGVVTDFAVHSLWMAPRVDRYFVASAEAARQLARRGHPADRIAVTGIPVDPVFAVPRPVSEVRAELGLRPDLPVVLVLCGGFGVGPVTDLLRTFRDEPFAVQVVVITGRNETLRREAEAIARTATLPVRVEGFVTNMHTWLNAADLLVSKPGGLTTAEALAMGKPMVIVDPIPGQEQRNAEMLLEEGAAVRLFEAADASWKVGSLLGDPARLALLSANALRLGRPSATGDIVAAVLG